MSQQTQAERDRWAAAQLNKQRIEELAFSFLNVPMSVEHEAHIGQSQCVPNISGNTSEQSQPIRPATTEPLLSNQFGRPIPPNRSTSEPKPEGQGALVSQNAPNGVRSSIGEDPTRQMIGMFSPAVGWVDFMAKLDTGVEGNWISEKCLEELNIRAKPNSAKLLTFETFDGKKIESREEVSIQWMFEKGQKTHRTIFRIAEDGAPFNVILGRVFMLSEDIITFNINGSLLLFVTQARTEAEEKAIIAKKAQVEAENKALVQRQMQEKALRKHLASQNRSTPTNSGGFGASERTTGRSSSRSRRS